MKNLESSPHDGLFKSIFKNAKNARDFLEAALPKEVVSRLDLGSVRVLDVSYVDDDLKKHFSDILLSAGLKDGPHEATVYVLFEHKSAPDNLVGLQLLRYMALKWTELAKNGELADGKLPPIVPLVFYQGQRKWKAFTSFRELVSFPSGVFEKYAPEHGHGDHAQGFERFSRRRRGNHEYFGGTMEKRGH